MLILRNISYIHPDKELLFQDVDLTLAPKEKVALVGNNGSGKSSLLRIIAGELIPASGQCVAGVQPFHMPQIFGQFDHLTIAQALRVDHKLNSLKEIMAGNTSDENLNMLADDWTIEERCSEALRYWQLPELDLSLQMGLLSGGQKTRVLLAGIVIHQSAFVLLDEPSNHLDESGRTLLYNFIRSTKSTLVVVSHDRKLLNLLQPVYELSKQGLNVYGGNYDFYSAQKKIEQGVLEEGIQESEKTLRKAREKERQTLERQQKLDARGKGRQEKAGIARIMMNTLRNNAEKSTAKLKNVHAEKIGRISQDLQELRSSIPGIDKMKIDFDDSRLHRGKVIFRAQEINFNFGSGALWTSHPVVEITSGERIALKGDNGSGKSTLLNVITGRLSPHTGLVHSAGCTWVYIDQDYSLLDNGLTVIEQAQRFNRTALHDHEVRSRLSRFLFDKESWNKPCVALSGGERMRLSLCCLAIGTISPDMIILDEPTNNLDIQNIEILASAIKRYRGTLIVVSHDETFLQEVGIERVIRLD